MLQQGALLQKIFLGGVVIGGNPAKVIGDMESFMEKRTNSGKDKALNMTKQEEADYAWEKWKKNLER